MLREAARRYGLNLIFDADDTLWHSNIHFLEAEAAFLELLSVRGIGDQTIRDAIRRHELDIISELGYGRRPYVLALHRAMSELLPLAHREGVAIELQRIGSELLGRHCELLPGV